MQQRLPYIAALIIGLLILASSCLFTVDQRKWAIVFQLGEIKEVIDKPGLTLKWPLIQNVRTFDKRILTYDTPDPAPFLTAEKKPVLVDFFVKWRIHDVRRFYESVSKGDEQLARVRLDQTIKAALQDEFNKRTLQEVVSGERDKVMADVQRLTDARARELGMQIVDVRIKRIELSPKVTDSVFARMESERKRVANELRSQGAADGEKIRADADKQREILLANAYRDAQKVKGEGDAEAAAIYGRAFSKNPEFYAFYRSLEAYRGSFKAKSDVLVVEPNSEFFKYLKKSGK